MSTVAPAAFLTTAPTPPVISSRAVPAADSTATAVWATISVGHLGGDRGRLRQCGDDGLGDDPGERGIGRGPLLAAVVLAPLSWPRLCWALSWAPLCSVPLCVDLGRAALVAVVMMLHTVVCAFGRLRIDREVARATITPRITGSAKCCYKEALKSHRMSLGAVNGSLWSNYLAHIGRPGRSPAAV